MRRRAWETADVSRSDRETAGGRCRKITLNGFLTAPIAPPTHALGQIVVIWSKDDEKIRSWQSKGRDETEGREEDNRAEGKERGTMGVAL